MDNQEILNIIFIGAIAIFIVIFIADLINLIHLTWEQSKPTPPQYADINWVKPQKLEEAEEIDVIKVVKTKTIATEEQLLKLPLSKLKAIAKKQKINVGNRKRPEKIVKLLGRVSLSEIT